MKNGPTDAAAAVAASLQLKGWVDLPASGYSMYPAIRSGKVCRFEAFQAQSVRRGDILLFVDAKRDRLVAHRLCKTTVVGTQVLYHCRGDSNLSYDEPMSEEQVLGKLCRIGDGATGVDPAHGLQGRWGRTILLAPWLAIPLQVWIRCRYQLRQYER